MLVRDLPMNFQPGALVLRPDVHVGLVNHYGVVVQTFPVPAVAHIDKNNAGHLNVKIETLEEFGQGREVKYEPVESAVPLAEMWNRVHDVAQARRPFGLLAFGETWNCESFANFVKQGLPVSRQADGFKALAGAAILAVVLIAVTSD